MPSAKPKRARSDASASRTLDDFFNPKPLANPHEPKSKNPNSKPAKIKPSFRASVEQEIIVIDSDSDDEPEIIETTIVKRRRLSPKNTNNDFNQSSSNLKTPAPEVNLFQAKENSDLNAQSFKKDSFHGSTQQDSFSFGDAFLLCSNSSPKNMTKAPVLSFGQPYLLGSAYQNSNPTTNRTMSTASCSKERSSNYSLEEGSSVDIDLTLDDWENGDDEETSQFQALNDVDPQTVIDAPSENQDPPLETDSISPIHDAPDDWDIETRFDESQVPDVEREFEALTSGGTFDLSHSSSTVPDLRTVRNSKHKANGNNAFSVLMSSFRDNQIWKEATVAEDKTFRLPKANGGRRKAPFYKVLQGMPIAVDAFKYGAIPGVTAYFLTHAHSDHYTNLSSSWKNGPIYCSQGTANLIIHMLSVDRKWVYPFPMDTPTLVPNTNGVTVTLIEANHCPGSCLFFFEGPQTVNAGDSSFKSSFVGSAKTFRYLHCGDFRASPRHILHPAVRGKTIDHVYLDTTYLDPKYTFPPQPLVISACAELAKRIASGESAQERASTMLSWISSSKNKGKEKEKPKLLVVVGTYSIGKERIVKAIARALDSKVYCDARKTAILKCQADPELDALLTGNPTEATVHLVPLSTIATDQLQIYLDRFRGAYDRVVGFRPTGWTYIQAAGMDQHPSVPTIISKSSQQDFTCADLKLSAKSTATLQLYPVPYSEHSSFYELTCFAMSFSWIRMIATVNVGSETSRGKMAKWVAKWEAERRKRGQDIMLPHRHPDYW